MVWNPFKPNTNNSKVNETPNVEISHKSKQMEDEFYNKVQKEKKSLLPQNAMTREEILKEIEKQYVKQVIKNDNPFKTREDVYYCFYNSNMELSRPPVPFEEIIIAGKKFYINKKFENGKIYIEEMFSAPDVEIDLKNEYDKKETTKGQLEKINKYLLYIKDQIARGEKNYELIDIEDLKEEKHRLERILSSIKFGKSAIFKIQNPFNLKPSYQLKYCNGEYKYLKITENNYITEENSVKAIKGQTILKKVEEIINLRITKSWKDILVSLMAIVIFCALMFGSWKMATFEEELFDKRVQDYCSENIELYKKELKTMKDWRCELIGINSSIVPLQQPQGFNVTK